MGWPPKTSARNPPTLRHGFASGIAPDIDPYTAAHPPAWGPGVELYSSGLRGGGSVRSGSPANTVDSSCGSPPDP